MNSMMSKDCMDLEHAALSRLPVRPRPVSGEATVGYLIRVAAANGFASPRALCGALRCGDFDTFCDRLGLRDAERSRLFGPVPSYWGWTGQVMPLSLSDFNQIMMRWCPLCLIDQPVLHGVWILKLCCVCPRHGILLFDRCAQCGQPQRFVRAELVRCPCGAQLSAATTTPANLSMVQVTEALARAALSGEPSSVHGLPGLDLAAWHRFVRYLGQFSESFQPLHPGQITGLHRMDVAVAFIRHVGTLLEHWPDNFHALIAAIHRTQVMSTSLRNTFGHLYHVLFEDLGAPCFQFLRDEFEDYVRQHWWGVMCKRHRSFKPEVVSTHPRVTVSQAAQLAGTKLAIVRHLIKASLIPSQEAVMASGRRACSIHRDDIPQIAALADGLLTLSEAARLLSLPESRVRELVGAGIIKPLVARTFAPSSPWLIRREQITALFLAGRYSVGIKVPLSHVMRFWRLREGEFVALIAEIVAGRLLPASESPAAIGNVLLDEITVHRWLCSRRVSAEKRLSIDEAARRLCLKQEVTYQLVRRGLLNAHDCGPLGRRIDLTDLDYFKDTYVSLIEIARGMNCSPRSALALIPATPICGPTVDGCRQYFYLKVDVHSYGTLAQ